MTNPLIIVLLLFSPKNETVNNTMQAAIIVKKPSPLPPLPYNCCSMGAELKIRMKITKITNIKNGNKKYKLLREILFCIALLKNIGEMIKNKTKTKTTFGTIKASLLLNGVMIILIKTE